MITLQESRYILESKFRTQSELVYLYPVLNINYGAWGSVVVKALRY